MAKKRKAAKPREQYVLPTSPKIKTVKRLLCLDPGKTNMGISVVGVDGQDRVKVVANAIMVDPVSELALNYKTGFDKWLAEIDLWVQLYQPHGIILERFMTRGTMGSTIECVGIMIGGLTARYNLPIKLLNAATWKNAFHRRFPTEELDLIYKVCKTTPHALDSVLIGCYGLGLALQREVHYTPDSIIEAAEQSSLIKLIARKPRED